MKKLLGISVVAMLAVSPMMANAADTDPVTPNYTAPTHTDSNAPTTNADPSFAAVGITVGDQSHIASTAYVKGAYNSAIAAVNKVAANNTTSAGNGLTKDGTTFKVNLTTGANDAAASGLELTGTEGSKTLQAKVDTTSIEINSNGALGVKAGGITSTQLADDAVTTAKITNGNVTFAKVATTDVVKSTDNSGNGIGTAGAQGTASDSKFVTEKAVAEALAGVASDAVITAGAGIAKSQDNTISVKLDQTASGLATNSNDELAVVAGDGIEVTASGVAAKLDGDTLANSANGLKVAAGGITSTELANNAVTTAKIENGAVTAAKLAPGVISSSVSTLASTDAGYDAWNGNATVASEKAVATEVANLKSGTLATINASTVSIFTTWGSDDGTAIAPVSVAAPNAYQQGS